MYVCNKQPITLLRWCHMTAGVFALLLLCEEKGCHMTSLVEKLLPPVNTLMKGAITGSCDHRLLWDTVGVVLDGMQELLESSRAVELGACKLLGEQKTIQLLASFPLPPSRWLLDRDARKAGGRRFEPCSASGGVAGYLSLPPPHHLLCCC